MLLFSQHDAQEFLRAFVDALHDDVNKVHRKPRYDTDISDHLRLVPIQKRKINLVHLIMVYSACNNGGFHVTSY